ncbi:hypothetical protein BZM27_37585 [Paraburkholderia steynii]|uniref:Uncharacterized protein n=1 Tax=Paraburkholderia steynii TaxID=1245441 RepID=A0A4R0X443_9BURK|nr:hypothetical protein BZM27_37585 [Paraburkholderia steynii]
MRSHEPLPPAQIVNMAVKPYVLLDWVVRCGACEDALIQLLRYAFLSEALCVSGHLPYAAEIVTSAQRRLAQFYAHASETGQWQLDDETYVALQGALSAYVAQLHIVSTEGLQRAGILFEEWKQNHGKGTALAQEASA